LALFSKKTLGNDISGVSKVLRGWHKYRRAEKTWISDSSAESIFL